MSYNGYYEFTISQIDNGYQKISDFDDETLFMNIYHFWRFSKYWSPYYRWGIKALKNLKRNNKRKWSKDFTNVNLFIELINQELKKVNPCDYFLILKIILLSWCLQNRLWIWWFVIDICKIRIKKLILKLENVLDDSFVYFLVKSIFKKMSFNRSNYEYFFPSKVFGADNWKLLW